MTVIFLTTQPEICQIFSNNLPSHTSFIFTNMDIFFATIKNITTKPDLVLMDYTLYNHEVYSIYHELHQEQIDVPVIFYNDPCLVLEDRVAHWNYMIHIMKTSYKEIDTEQFDDIFQTINALVTSPELSPYINLMQKTKPLPEHLLISKIYTKDFLTKAEIPLKDIRDNPFMTKAAFVLFEILINKSNEEVTAQEIIDEYKKLNKPLKDDSLKVNISKLRSILKKMNSDYSIITTNNGYKMIRYV